MLKSILLSGALLSLAAPAIAQPAAPTGVRNIVLVHGAFADGSGWRGVYDQLTAKGYKVRIVQNPLSSLEDDVAATNRVIARQSGGLADQAELGRGRH